MDHPVAHTTTHLTPDSAPFKLSLGGAFPLEIHPLSYDE